MLNFNLFDLTHLPIIYLTTDILFYIFHRIFHCKYLYRFHKVHHEFKKPIALSGLYLHPIDYVIGNIIPIFFTILYLESSLFILHIWIFLVVSGIIIESHRGKKDLSEYHDIHHKYFKYNYGTNIAISDIIFGTKYNN